MSVQKAIFPGMLAGIFLFFGMVTLLRTGASYVSHSGGEPVMTAGLSLAPAAEEAPAVQSAPASQAVWDGSCTIAASYPQSVQQWCELIERYARENGLEPDLVSAVMLQESNGRPDAYSKSGAVGLLQVMPRDGLASKFMCKNGPCFSDRPNMEELFDPEFNVAYGAKMLANLVQHYGNLRDALKAYGPKDVGYYYADLVLNTVKSYR
jgi:soluble lytic murein transglycosylase-like protein